MNGIRKFTFNVAESPFSDRHVPCSLEHHVNVLIFTVFKIIQCVVNFFQLSYYSRQDLQSSNSVYIDFIGH